MPGHGLGFVAIVGIFLAAGPLPGCSTLQGRDALLQADQIVEYEPGKYRLRKTSYFTLGSGASLLAAAHREAGEYCGKHGKTVRTIAEDTTDAIPLDRYPGALLLFECG